MGSVPPPPAWQSAQAQDYEAAESMLQHSRAARNVVSQPLTTYQPSDPQNYAHQPTHLPKPSVGPSISPYSQYSPTFGSSPTNSNAAFSAITNGSFIPPPNLPRPVELPPPRLYPQVQDQGALSDGRNATPIHVANAEPYQRVFNAEKSMPTSPTSTRENDDRRQDRGGHGSSNEAGDQVEVKEESELKPSWAYEKTKAGKERKRLPLACIACRRKKIRCSGEKPACKHCTRARMPCVYKVTARKAAPRTDYMAMLDRRLKRMEERVIRIIPKAEAQRASKTPRAVLKPSASSHAHGGKKRGADEAFGEQVEEWVKSKPHPHSYNSAQLEESAIFKDGSEHLPPKPMQAHLSEVFFDYVYGQSYHLMHQPSYMRKLNAGTLPPVLVLAVCAVAARFSTHPELKGVPEYLRGEEWAAPARDIVLKRYDEPSISILTVTIILGLHEFGTCQGGRSWMFAGMATRMAHALQLHRELDHDPLGTKNDQKAELSFLDREIRRRAMWACFMMDRFTASGTERPMFADEEDIRVQLPIDEGKFNLEIPGPTEDLEGHVHQPTTPDTGQSSDPKANMGVAAYVVRAIALWGRVIKHLNMGGKEKDRYPIWDERSRFQDLRKQALELKTKLPLTLRYTPENLQSHASGKVANQFIFLHVALNQIFLFLHKFAVPTGPGSRPPKDVPRKFFHEAFHTTMDAANEIATLLDTALDYHVVAPFTGYCAFTSSTVLIWAHFFGNRSLKEVSMKHLAQNVHYLRTMKEYWGVLHFMAKNLKDMYKRSQEAVRTGNKDPAKTNSDIFQFGDWFDKFPHGVSRPVAEEVEPSKDKAVNNDTMPVRSSHQEKVEDFFDSLAPAKKQTSVKKPKKPPKPTTQVNRRPSQPQPAPLRLDSPDLPDKLPVQVPDTGPPVPPSPFTPAPQMFANPQIPYPPPNDFGHFGAAHPSLIPQLDRQLVYGAYAGNDPTASTSASALDALTNTSASQEFNPVNGGMWDGSPTMHLGQQQMMVSGGGDEYIGDYNSTAWFMPFNLQPSPDGGYGGPGN